MDDLVNFRIQICDLINNTDLIFSAKYFILKDIMSEIEKVYQQYLLSLQSSKNMTMSEPETKTETFEISVPVEEDKEKKLN